LIVEVRSAMDVTARITSKGQVTIPKPVREALNLGEGDQIVFRVIDGGRAILARTPDLLDLEEVSRCRLTCAGCHGRRSAGTRGRDSSVGERRRSTATSTA
jgi:AbrB family looped-hinge helix DNA binding protein